MSSQAFASLAQVQIHLIPVGDIALDAFAKWATEIRTIDSIRLSDVPAEGIRDQSRFMPSPLSTGYIHLSFPSHSPSLSHSSLSLFRPSHFPLGAIGIADCSNTKTLSTISDQFKSALQSKCSRIKGLPFASICLAFEDQDIVESNVEQQQPGVVVIPGMLGNKKLYISTLIAELCSVILGDFSTLAKYMETTAGLDLLNSTLFPQISEKQKSPLDWETVEEIEPTPRVLLRRKENESHRVLKRATESPSSKALGVGTSDEESKNSTNANTSLPMTPSKKRLSSASSLPSHARQYKLLGDLFLLAGRTSEALIWYKESVSLFKSTQDSVWYASALEGLATVGVLDAWLSGNGLNASFSKTQEPWADHSEKLAQAVSFYSKVALLSADDMDLPLLSYLYINGVFRHSFLLFSIWSAKGWGPLAFMAMLHPGPLLYVPPTLASDAANSSIYLDHMSAVTGISRSDISIILSQAHGPWLLHLFLQDRLETLQIMARMYSFLGFARKEAYVIRELVNFTMDFVVGNDSASSFVDDGTEQRQQSGANSSARDIGSLLRLVNHVCNSHGIDLDAVKFVSESSDAQSAAVRDMESTIVKRRGWPELLADIAMESVDVAGALSAYSASIRFSLSTLKTQYQILDDECQQTLYNTSCKAFHAINNDSNVGHRLQCWFSDLVTDVKVARLKDEIAPYERHNPKSSLSLQSGNISAMDQDPFYYNPRRQQISKAQLYVQDNPIEFLVTLNNPYSVPLDIHSLRLSATGVSFEAESLAVILQPNGCAELKLIGTPLQAGTLIIRGCILESKLTIPREFLSLSACETGKTTERSNIKSYGSSLQSARERDTEAMDHRFRSIRIISKLPLLRIQRSSLEVNNLILYHGERSVISITLQNISSLPVDYLNVTFNDSIRDDTEVKLAEGNLLSPSVYELEYDIIKNPVFAWDATFHGIQPAKEEIILIECTGKAGCSQGTICISYSSTQSQQNALSDSTATFYTRQLLYSINFSIHQVLDCTTYNVYLNDSPDDQGMFPFNDEMMNPHDRDNWCFLALNIRNNHRTAFEVTLYSISKATDGPTSAETTRSLTPGSMQRFLLPMKRISLPETVTSSAIPSLSDRQFVISKAGLNSDQERLERELFWYREELLTCVRARWKEVDGQRYGELPLRNIELTYPMLMALKMAPMSVTFTINGCDAEEFGRPTYANSLSSNTIHCFSIAILNKTTYTLESSLDLDISPADGVMFDGTQHKTIIGLLRPNQSRVIQRSICFMMGGRFDISWRAKNVASSTALTDGHFHLNVQY